LLAFGRDRAMQVRADRGCLCSLVGATRSPLYQNRTAWRGDRRYVWHHQRRAG
jgi:hypothetical protein